MSAIHLSVRVATVRGALSHGDHWELYLLKCFIILIVLLSLIIITIIVINVVVIVVVVCVVVVEVWCIGSSRPSSGVVVVAL